MMAKGSFLLALWFLVVGFVVSGKLVLMLISLLCSDISDDSSI